MRTLITKDGQLGKFNHIETLSDRYVCDGVEYQFSVIGDVTIGEYVEPPPPPPTREFLKEQRTLAVEAIKVTTSHGNTFDGDEISQGRMARAILGLQAAGVATVTWVLSNNTPIQVTASELGEALALAGAAQAALWVI